jgi:hypothetical protein
MLIKNNNKKKKMALPTWSWLKLKLTNLYHSLIRKYLCACTVLHFSRDYVLKFFLHLTETVQ